MAFHFVPINPTIGATAEIDSKDLLTPHFANDCLEALERYGVLVFPQINLSNEQQVAVSKNLGDVTPQGRKREDGSQDVIFNITLDPKESTSPGTAEYLKSTVHFHIDGLLDSRPPPKATLLLGQRLSHTGGQTEFSNMYAAYEQLSTDDKTLCESVRIVHSLAAANRVYNPQSSPEEQARWAQVPPREHPLVWTHKSGRKSLILGMTMDHVVGMPDDESRELIKRLNETVTQPEQVYRHEWQVGDLLIWDNTGVMHRAVPYPADSGRLMHRTVLQGNESIQ